MRNKLLDSLVSQRRAPDADVLAVDVNIAARLFVIAEQAIGLVGIIQAEGKMIQAFGIEAVDFVKSFRNLAIAFPPFRAGHAGTGEDRIAIARAETAPPCRAPKAPRRPPS